MGFRLRFNERIIGNIYKVSSFFVHEDKELEIWFEVPLSYKDKVTSLADPFLIALLFPAMETGNKIIVEGKNISKGLIENLNHFQNIWHKWKPELYTKIDIQGQEETRTVKPKLVSVCAFTGGIDSSFVLHNELCDKTTNEHNITTALFVHGFHIPVFENQAARLNYDRISKICTAVGVELINVKSNLRGFGNWNDIHGAAVVASLNLFKDDYRQGIIASSHPYKYLRLPWGSNPISDVMLSSDNFKIINYGGEFTRIEKLQKLKDWDVFKENVIVCSVNFSNNCGKCEKCIRTMLGFRALGVTIPSHFVNKNISFGKVLFLRAYLSWEIRDYKLLLRTGLKNRPGDPLFYLLFLNILLNSFLMLMFRVFGKKWVYSLKKNMYPNTTKKKLYTAIKQ